jgi:tRNA (guanine-N7-)-methyltransferase
MRPPMGPNVAKKNYRQRAHTNPFKDMNIDIPRNPQSIDWLRYFRVDRRPEFADIGCGYGRFLMGVAEQVPEICILGLEIRDKVHDYVKAVIEKKEIPNAGVMRTNALIFLPNIFGEDQLSKIFILFPDPHFKKRKQKGRVVCRQMLDVYVYILRSGGRLYISTDVKELYDGMVETVGTCEYFHELTEEEKENDELYEMTFRSTDEALRAGAKTGHTFATIFEMDKRR